jgi:hypothetical protein
MSGNSFYYSGTTINPVNYQMLTPFMTKCTQML